MNTAQAASSPITVSASPGAIQSGQGTAISYTLPATYYGNVMVMINDSDDHIVWSTYLPDQSAGPGTITWNGKDSSGNNAPEGQYTVKLTLNNGSIGTPGAGVGQFNQPNGVAVDGEGNVYVADTGNNRIQVFDSSGNHLTTFGTPGTGDGQLHYPKGVAVDSDGRIYVADGRIQVFDSSGKYLYTIGTSGEGDGQYKVPLGVAVNEDFIYVADTGNNRIQVFAGTMFLNGFGTTGIGAGEFMAPHGVAVDGAGHIYVADMGNNRIQAFTAGLISGSLTPGITIGGLNHPGGVAVDGAGHVYVADTGNNRVLEYTDTGAFVAGFGTPGAGDGQLNYPGGVAVDGVGKIYVADTGNNRIQVFYPGGVEGVTSLTVDDTAPAVQLNIDNPNSNGWYTSDVPFSLGATDGAGGSGADTIQYSFDNLNWITGTASTITAEGVNTLYWNCTDKAGNSATGSQVVKVDKTGPAITGEATTQPNRNGWYNHDVEVHFQATDPFSGVFHVDPNVLLTAEGKDQTATGTAEDVAGNTNTTTVTGINIDKTRPSATCTLDGTQVNGWYTTDVRVTLTAIDEEGGSGIDTIRYSLDNLNWQVYQGTFAVPMEGSNTLYWNCSDKAGNSRTGSRVFKTDKTAPATVATASGTTVTLAATDAASGVNYTEYRVDDGAWIRYTAPVTVNRTSTVRYRSADVAGNIETAKTFSFDQILLASGTISMGEMYSRATPTPTPTPAATVTPVPTATGTPSATPMPSTSATPVPSATPAPTTAENPQSSEYLLWIALGSTGILGIAAGAYILFFRK